MLVVSDLQSKLYPGRVYLWCNLFQEVSTGSTNATVVTLVDHTLLDHKEIPAWHMPYFPTKFCFLVNACLSACLARQFMISRNILIKFDRHA